MRTAHFVLIINFAQVTADIKGFQLILISDEHETPIVDLKTKPFIAMAKDWSTASKRFIFRRG